MHRTATFGVAVPAVALLFFSESCGGSVIGNETRDGGGDTTNSSTSAVCGADGGPCCNGLACDNGLTCIGGTCVGSGGPCGASGDPCCNGSACDNGLTCSGGVCSGGSSVGDDAGAGNGDGAIEDAAFDVSPAPSGLAGFAFVVNGIVQEPMTCTGAHWEFPWVQGEAVPEGGLYPPIAGITSVVIVNTGTLPMPYLAQSYWSQHAVPGGLTGQTYQLAGVLNSGDQVDITSVYLPGIVALLGSAEPFSAPDAGYAADEGTIPWPNGVPGSGGATTMNLAEIEVPYNPMACQPPSQQWLRKAVNAKRAGGGAPSLGWPWPSGARPLHEVVVGLDRIEPCSLQRPTFRAESIWL